MDTTEHYTKARRNVCIFSGLLALSSVVGISEKAGTPTSLVPFELKTPDAIPDILAVAVAFLVYDFGVQWISQDQSYRKIRIRTIDFFAIVTVASISLVVYWWTRFNFLKNIFESLPGLDAIKFPVLAAIGGLLGYATTTIFSRWAKSKTKNILKEDVSIESILISKSWLFQFNPSSPQGKKVLSFNADGTIGEGANKNETRWRVRNGLLEIMNSDDKVFSRFEYNEKEEKFIHTNDGDTLSLRGQYITAFNG